MLTADSDEILRVNRIFNRQKGFGEHFLFARSEMDVRIIDFPLKIENFIGENGRKFSQYERISEVISSL